MANQINLHESLIQEVQDPINSNAKWGEAHSLRDLVIKKIGLTLIALLNLGVLGAACYFTASTFLIPAEALIISPIIVGILTALANLHFPTCGVSGVNYKDSTNPLTIVGKALTYLFFCPYMYTVNRLDWTPYHDPKVANKISNDLENKSFTEIADTYGRNFSNLIRYGFIDEQYRGDLNALYREYKPVKAKFDYWNIETEDDDDEPECDRLREAQAEMVKIDAKWEALREQLGGFPHPEKPDYNFSSTVTRIKLAMSSYFFSTPFDELITLKA